MLSSVAIARHPHPSSWVCKNFGIIKISGDPGLCTSCVFAGESAEDGK